MMTKRLPARVALTSLAVHAACAQHLTMSNDAGKKLFHAIVIAGATMGACTEDGTSPADGPEAGTAAAPPTNSGGAGVPTLPGSGGAGGAMAGTGGAGGTTSPGSPPDAATPDEDAEVAFPHITQ